MMFVIDYDRARGALESIDLFEDADRDAADAHRLLKELAAFRQGLNREIVILQAASIQALQGTHRRYFADLSTLAELPAAAGDSPVQGVLPG